MNEHVKMVVYVPRSHADKVRKAMGEAGAGRIGAYSFCSFSVTGEGRFLGDEGSHPAFGEPGKLETVQEERIEALCEKSSIENVLAAIKQVHPYEEIPVDIYPVESRRISNSR